MLIEIIVFDIIEKFYTIIQLNNFYILYSTGTFIDFVDNNFSILRNLYHF